MSFLILLGAAALRLCAPSPVNADPAPGAAQSSTETYVEPTPERIEAYIRNFVGLMRDGRRKKSPALSELIVRLSLEAQVDPWVVVVLIRHESSFFEGPDILGVRGEQGLMQVLHRATRKKYNMMTSEGQIRAGIHVYKWGLRKCSSEEEAFRFYQTGYCDGKPGNLRGRLNALRNARNGKLPRKTR
jgi:hypothetical protein